MLDHAAHEPAEDLRQRLEMALGAAYTIEEELGGGMSRVFIARERSLGRRVCVKVLPPDRAGINVARFKREIRLSAQLQHPHIVPVLAAGEAGGIPYYTMPFIQGESLHAMLRRRATVPATQAMTILRDVIDALAHAHEQGVVHRDIKPDNILMSGRYALVCDFGIAKALSAASLTEGGTAADTDPRIIVGTPAYMAPEQAAGDPGVDQRADLYAFGVLAYELLTGYTPYTRRAPRLTMTRTDAAHPLPLDELRPDLPLPLAHVLMACLEQDPARRPQRASVVLREIELALAPAPVAIPERLPLWRMRLAAIAAAALLGSAAVGGAWVAGHAHEAHIRAAENATMHAPSVTDSVRVTGKVALKGSGVAGGSD